MQVTVALYANLGRYHPRGGGHREFILDVPAGTHPGAILERLQIPVEEHKQVFVNNRRRDLDYVLKEGDRVAVFPPVAGG